MAVPNVSEKWSGQINTLRLGATQAEGGTRGSTVTVGGQSGIPFVDFDGGTPNPPVIALDVLDQQPSEWPAPLAEVYSDVWSDPAAWAAKAKQLGADLINLRLESTHPDEGDASPEAAAETVKAVLAAVDLPLIIWGCGVPKKDQLVMPKVAEAAQGENCLLGAATARACLHTDCKAIRATVFRSTGFQPCPYPNLSSRPWRLAWQERQFDRLETISRCHPPPASLPGRSASF